MLRGLPVAAHQRRLRMAFRAAEKSAALRINQQPLSHPFAEQIAGSKLAVPFRIWISSIATALPFPFFTIEPPIKVEIVELPLSNRERTITSHFHKLIRIFW